MFFAFLDFVECCFKKSASAGRGSRAGRFCCFTSDSAPTLHCWCDLFEETSSSIGAAEEQTVLASAIELELDRCSLSLICLVVSTVELFLGNVVRDPLFL